MTEPTVSRTIHRVEDTLMQSGKFTLPGKKKVEQSDMIWQFVVVDTTETPIERPKKSNAGSTSDLRLLQASKLSLSDSVICSGDSGYQGMHKMFSQSKTPAKKPKKGFLTTEQKQSNKEQRREQVCVEHTMRRLKVFKILSYRYPFLSLSKPSKEIHFAIQLNGSIAKQRLMKEV